MKNYLYINHLKKFIENEKLALPNFETLMEEEEKKEQDNKKLEEVRSTLSSNCRIVKIEDEEIEILKWNSLKNIKINDFIINSLNDKFHFKTFLPCQSCILQYILFHKNGSSSLINGDIYIEVPTGLGKTLCYIISILDYFLYEKDKNLFCLILTATEELVNQIITVIKKFDINNLICKNINTNMFHSNIYFDEIIDNDNTFKDCNIIVTTTSKFEMLFYNNEDMFKHLKFLIIDEVDKILSFNKSNISSIVNSLTNIVEKYQNSTNNLYKPKYFLQKILVSATLCKVSDNIMSLNLYRPIFFYYILNYKRNEEFYLYTKNKYYKLYFLIKLITDIHNKNDLNMLIFCDSEASSHNLFRYLTIYFSYTNEKYYSIKEYNRNLSNLRKKKILNEFLNKKLNILICTDSISRGLDTVNLNYLVNYDMPKHYNILTHRIGRLGRYNSSKGIVYHFIKKSEKAVMNKSAKQRNIKLIEQMRFKKNKLLNIKKNILHLKPLIKNTINMENKEIIKYHKYYSYEDLMKLSNQ
ncbi:ATP-dependent RNA helicase, putative [Plasmodium gallinaceum]|uniref:ATP-dependent RNA helicase n=1 Tax=Plasmodium gallinaceum TaxID=5849 RepID=A0A1J1H444_PLAGA|nr:ATP-dependent RNA helicase, putative [Plasmodium gallinaceum]CRG98122.1 ATP-dependent RNA helicase, putative [Plasmodium gallinaceum]